MRAATLQSSAKGGYKFSTGNDSRDYMGETQMKKRLVSKTLGAIALLLSLGASHAFAVSDTRAVWEHHIQAWEERNVDDIVSDYSDDSVLILNNRVHKGQKQIADVFRRLFEIFDGGVNRINTPIVLERFVYITWHFTPTGRAEFYGTDTFVIENGKIVLQTIASPLYDALRPL